MNGEWRSTTCPPLRRPSTRRSFLVCAFLWSWVSWRFNCVSVLVQFQFGSFFSVVLVRIGLKPKPNQKWKGTVQEMKQSWNGTHRDLGHQLILTVTVLGAFVLNVIVVLLAVCYFDPTASKPPLMHRLVGRCVFIIFLQVLQRHIGYIVYLEFVSRTYLK